MADAVAVAAHGLTKSCRRRRAIEEVTFEVERGQICGLLGPNPVRCGTNPGPSIATQTRARTPAASRLGAPNKPAVPRSGRERPTSTRMVVVFPAPLDRAFDAKVKTYSMGMRQRLMVTQALMGAPELLILDEPANGLDPGEVRALREHLRKLAERGAAVTISSHLLAEIELLATHAVVMNKGAVLARGRLQELLGAGSYEFEVDDLALCLLSLGSIALALGLLLPRSVEALGISVALLIGSVMVDDVRALHAVAVRHPSEQPCRSAEVEHGPQVWGLSHPVSPR